jgi:glycosyltransferase involved in cell wall biosynthesis
MKLARAGNIGIVVPLAEKRGGAEQALRDFLLGTESADRSRIRVLFLEDGPMVADTRALGYSTDVINAGRLRNVIRFVSTVFAIHRWIKTHGFSVVVSWMSKAHLYTSLPARMLGAEPVWFQHDVFAGSRLDRINSALPSSLVLCCSRVAAEAQSRAFPSVPVRAIAMAVDHNRFNPEACISPEAARRELGLRADIPSVTLVARLERWKGVHVFVGAALILLESGKDLQFLIVGSDHPHDLEYGRELRKTVSESKRGSNIVFAGHQTNVPMWMCASDIVVHCSTKPEPFGIVVLEALALGRPLIASASGGPLEVVDDGVDGILIEPGSSRLLADAIASLLADDEKRVSLAAHGVLKASRYTPARFAGEVTNALDALVPS